MKPFTITLSTPGEPDVVIAVTDPYKSIPNIHTLVEAFLLRMELTLCPHLHRSARTNYCYDCDSYVTEEEKP